MTSPILVGSNRIKHRLDVLEANMAEMRGELEAEREGRLQVDEGTSKIEEFDSLELQREKEKNDKLKETLLKNMKEILEAEVKDLKVTLEKDLREELILEQQVLFQKLRDELRVKVRRDMEKIYKKQTVEQQEKMFLNMLVNHKVNVESRSTQVEFGDLPINPLPDTVDIKMGENQEDSVSLLAS